MTGAELLLAAAVAMFGADAGLRLLELRRARRRERLLGLVGQELLRRLRSGQILIDVTGGVEEQRGREGGPSVYRFDGAGTMVYGEHKETRP